MSSFKETIVEEQNKQIALWRSTSERNKEQERNALDRMPLINQCKVYNAAAK